MYSALIALAAQIGVPLIEKVLSRKLGAGSAELITDVIRAIAERAGVAPEALPSLAENNPPLVIDAMRATEAMAPELIALYAAGIEAQFALAKAETESEHFLSWAWRPAAMWGFGFLWFWNIVILHVANAYWKIALPQTDLGTLFQLNAVYMGLYMGGHTVKDFVDTRWGASK
ncbi:MAG: hypothetical protein CVT82_00400 [Alphaproteobacteria bacterium HGW-Alphaproteobacteria-4]|jgi:hypothetical protein|nr:MAG: hypothetical protein CVT82_00400 [Alphaproteobacteria bacterium HGW-Alphaproteobacteria-4]